MVFFPKSLCLVSFRGQPLGRLWRSAPTSINLPHQLSPAGLLISPERALVRDGRVTPFWGVVALLLAFSLGPALLIAALMNLVAP